MTMPLLETSQEDRESARETEPTDEGLTFEVEGTRVSVRETPDAEECAALACAVAAHLRAEREAEAETERGYRTPAWKLVGRLGSRRRARIPRDCPQGSEWKYATRASVR